MEKFLLCVMLFASFNFVKAQTNKPFRSYELGFYGGLNFHTTEKIRGDFLAAIGTKLAPSLKVKAAVGYCKTIEPYYLTVREYSGNPVDTIPKYVTSKYNLLRKDYDVFPVSLGLQYNFNNGGKFTPYFSVDAVYNFINASFRKSPSEVRYYNSLSEIPNEYKRNQTVEKLPENSYGVMLGAGVSYKLSSKLNLDFRYIFKYDSEIANTHHLLVGIWF